MIFFFSVGHSSLCIFPSSTLPPPFQGTPFGTRVVGLMPLTMDPALRRPFASSAVVKSHGEAGPRSPQSQGLLFALVGVTCAVRGPLVVAGSWGGGGSGKQLVSFLKCFLKGAGLLLPLIHSPSLHPARHTARLVLAALCPLLSHRRARGKYFPLLPPRREPGSELFVGPWRQEECAEPPAPPFPQPPSC